MALPLLRQPTKSQDNGERSDVIQTLEADEFNQDWAQNSGLTARSTQALQSVGVLRTWTDGQVLLSRGQPTSAAWLVVSGRVRVSVITSEGEEQLLRWILPGEIGGLSSVFAKASNPVDMVSHDAGLAHRTCPLD
jgi:CRP-like cAMP-binding protein